MHKLIGFAVKHPWLVLAILLLVTLVAALQLPNLRMEVTAEGMMVKDDPARIAYQASLETFGDDNITVVYLEDEDLFEPENLALVRTLITEIETSPLVSSTDSLFSVPHLRVTDDFLHTDPYLAEIPQTPAATADLIRAAVRNPLIVDNLLSADGNVMAINIALDTSQYHSGSDAEFNAMLAQALQPLQSRLERVFFIGDPSVRAGINSRIHEDQKNILPIALFILVITLAVMLRKVSGAIIPLLTAITSVIWTLGLMSALDIPLNVMTSIIPALLIIIGSTEDIHLLSEYWDGIDRNLDKPKALDFMSKNMATAVLLTFITTYFGFLSISLNSLELLQQFGLVASTGLLLNFLVTVTLVPICLRLFGQNNRRVQKLKKSNRSWSISLWLLDRIIRFRVLVIGSLLMVAVVCLYGATQVKVNNNIMDYFDADAPISVQAKVLHENLSGIQTFSIILSGTEGTFSKATRLEEIWALQEFLSETGDFDKSFSFADFMAVIHSGLDDEDSDETYLPESDDVISEYLSLLDKDAARSLVSENFDETRIIVRHNIESSYALNLAVSKIYDHGAELLDAGVAINVTGESYLGSKAVDYMADGQVRSLLLMLIVIFGIVSMLFMNTKAGLVSVAANAFPIIVLFGVMGFVGLPMDTGTSMVAAISLGVCVDHTMHFMVRYHRASKSLGSEYKALQQTMQEESTPIVATAIALSLGFGALMISEFPPVARFGMLSALVMLTALVSTFLITPIMLHRTRLLTVWDLLSINVRDSVLRNSLLFKNMSKWQVRKLLALSKIEEYQNEEAILTQGEEGNSMYVILNGEANVWRTREDGSAIQVNTLGAGEVFGMVSMTSNQRRSANVVAVQDVTLLQLRWEDIRRVGRIFPYIANRLYENLLRVVGDLLVEIEARRPAIRDELSGAYNATYFRDLVDFAVQRANRHSEELAVLVVDVLHYDTSKTEYKGNSILREVSDAILSFIRSGDVYARWHGTRFLVLMPGASMPSAQTSATRMRENLEKPELVTPGSADISIQVAVLQADEAADVFLDRMDNIEAAVAD